MDMREAQEYRVQSTPSFFINGIPVIGSQPFEVFDAVISYKLDRLALEE